MSSATYSEGGTLLRLLEQKRAQPPADKLVEHVKGARVRVLEVFEPAVQQRIEISDDDRETLPACSSCLCPDAILEPVQALLADKTPADFEPIAEELEPFPALPAVADMRLARMQTQAVVRHPGTYLCQGSVRLLAALTQNHEVVRIAHHPIAASCHQLIQRVQVDVSQQRADNCSLRSALSRRPSLQVLHDVLLEPAVQELEDTPITYALLDPLHQPLMWDRVEVAFEVGVDYEGVAVLDQLRHLAQRTLAAASRPKAVARRSERRLEDRFQGKLPRRLDDAILDRGYPQWSRPAVALRDLDPPDRLRTIAMLPQCRRKLGQIQFRMRLEPFDALAISPRRAFIGRDFLPGRFQRCGRTHLIHQTVPTTSFDAVNQRRHHADCPDRSFHPRPVAGFCTLCSPCGHCRSSLCFFPVHSTSTFLPTFPRHGFAFRAFHGYRRTRPMRAPTPSAPRRRPRALPRAAPRPRDRSPHSIPSPSGPPIPPHVVRPNVTPNPSCARPA